jgi:hypothetical protein
MGYNELIKPDMLFRIRADAKISESSPRKRTIMCFSPGEPSMYSQQIGVSDSMLVIEGISWFTTGVIASNLR